MSTILTQTASAVRSFFGNTNSDTSSADPESSPNSRDEDRDFEGHGVGQGIGGGGMIGLDDDIGSGSRFTNGQQTKQRESAGGFVDGASKAQGETGEQQEMGGVGGIGGSAGGGEADLEGLGDGTAASGGIGSAGTGTTSLTLGGGITGGS